MNRIGWEINAKYFAGLIKLGLQNRIPGWYGTLRTQAASEPMRREPPVGAPEFYGSEDSIQLAIPRWDSSGTGERTRTDARTEETAADTDFHASAGQNITVTPNFSSSQAQYVQTNMSLGFYREAILGELDRAYQYAQSAAPEIVPAIEAAQEAAREGDTRGLTSRLRSLDANLGYGPAGHASWTHRISRQAPRPAPVIERAIHRGDLPAQTDLDQAVTQMVGPLFVRIVSGYRGQRLYHAAWPLTSCDARDACPRLTSIPAGTGARQPTARRACLHSQVPSAARPSRDTVARTEESARVERPPTRQWPTDPIRHMFCNRSSQLQFARCYIW